MRIFTSGLLGVALGLLSSGASLATENEVVRQLQQRNSEFEQAIIQVSENVYTAVGYAVSAVSMIVGDDGVLIVDAGIDVASSHQIREDFREITPKPVKAVVITHGHPDHLGGLAAFMDSADVQVWVREGFQSESNFLRDAGVTRQRQRGAMQAGFLLPPAQRINNGIAKPYWPNRGGAVFESTHEAKPSHFATQARTSLSIAGIDIDLVAADGETSDHLYLWFAKERVLFSGDNFYKSWPNLYPIRGSAYRDVRKWILAVDAMLREGPDAMVGGHTRPIVGTDEVSDVLSNYRDAIRFVFDKTVEGMNRGLTPDQLVDYVQLPEQYAELDYLKPYYGNPEWAVRSIFNGYLGWFDGNATNLFPLRERDGASRMADLAGGLEVLQLRASEALEKGDYQWVMQLCDYILVLEPDSAAAMQHKADAMTAQAQETFTTTARNYYLSSAKALRARAGSL